MARPKHRADGKRRLFHAITSKIPHYIPTIQAKHDSNSGDTDHNETKEINNHNNQMRLQSNTHEDTNLNSTGKEIGMHLNLGVLQQNLNKQTSSPFGEDNTYRDASNPVTQGTDTGNFSYIESVRKAPSKKHSNNISNSNAITPTYPFRSNSSILMNPGPNGIGKFSFSPAENSDVSFAGKTDSIIINESLKGDMNEYDYKTFGTKHPLRLSKVKGFEQSELTSKSYFSVVESKQQTNQSAKDELILQIPYLSVEETRRLLSYETVDRVSERRLNKRRYYEADTNKPSPSNVDKRLQMMKNVLAPMSTVEIMSRKLEESRLSKTFQQNGEFLKELDSEEIDVWSSMNEEFEMTLKKQRKQYVCFVHERRRLIDVETLRTMKSVMKHRNKEQFNNKKLGQTLSTFVCRRIKDDLSK